MLLRAVNRWRSFEKILTDYNKSGDESHGRIGGRLAEVQSPVISHHPLDLKLPVLRFQCLFLDSRKFHPMSQWVIDPDQD